MASKRTGFTRRQGRSRPKRGTDWHNADTTPIGGAVLVGVQLNTALWSPVTLEDNATVVRIVGTLWVAPDPDFDIQGTLTSTLHMGIQIVNRAAGAVGTARDPSLPDDREGGEWMWLGQAFQHARVTSSTEEPPSQYIQLSPLSSYNPYIDIRVKRKIDKSQDEIILSIKPLGGDWFVSCNLRMLVMDN